MPLPVAEFSTKRAHQRAHGLRHRPPRRFHFASIYKLKIRISHFQLIPFIF